MIAIVLLCSGLSVFGYWLDAELSKPAGKAGVVIQNNDPNNQITSQENFLKLFEQIQGYEDTIKTSSDPQNVALAKDACKAAVENYNTMAQGTTTKDYRPADEPPYIAITDCD